MAPISRFGGLQRIRLKSDFKGEYPATAAAPPQTISLRPQGAIVEFEEEGRDYGRLHLLGLPHDIRAIIWDHITADILHGRHQLDHKPWHYFTGVLLVCRKLYHESQESLHRFDVTWNRLDKLLHNVPNATTVRRIQRLTFEIPQDADRAYIRNLSGFLQLAQFDLRELRLYFYGSDKYGTRLYKHGCGNLEDDGCERKLPIDGQHFEKFLPLWRVIRVLRRLEVLVIANANLQVYQQMLLEQKPFLQYVSITTDPRSTIHKQHSITLVGSLLTAPTVDMYPPVEVLNISANAALISVQVVNKLRKHLRHLTWTVPDTSLKSGGMETPWYQHTAQIFEALRLGAPQIATIRICIAGAGVYEGTIDYNTFMGSIIRNMRFISTLRNFELHMKNKSPFFGQELLAAMPNGLMHFYLSDRVVHPYDLLKAVVDKVLSGDTRRQIVKRGETVNPHQYKTQPRKAEELIHLAGKLCNNQEPWFIHFDPVSYHGCELNPEEILERSDEDYCLVSRRSNRKTDDYIDYYGKGIVGEDLDRGDYIPFHTLGLHFIHYEYDHSDAPVSQKNSLSVLQVMLWINGRLIDRRRNLFLGSFEAGSHIEPWLIDKERVSKPVDPRDRETATNSANIHYATMLYNLYNIENEQPRNSQAILAELEVSHFPSTKYDRYFGGEHQAQQIFEREEVARVDHDRPSSYLIEREVCVDGTCHWTCADAELPTIKQRERYWFMQKQSLVL